jgi:hypothetical protein
MKHKQAAQMPQLSNDWRAWIAENLGLGIHPDALSEILVKSGASVNLARAEINAAITSPYLHGGQRTRNRLAKRDWVLNTQARLKRMAPQTVVRKHKLAGDDFLRDHYSQNQPVIITGMLDDCVARTRWSIDDFAARFSEREVEVQFGRNADQQYELNSIAHKKQMLFGDYVRLVRDSGATNDFYMTANNNSKNRDALHELWDDMPALTEYMNGEKGGFFWFGPKGTVTPFHHDLTNNFMAQFIGSKKVRLIAPYEINVLNNQRHCFTDVDGRDIDLARFPQMAGVPVLDVVLEEGEILFLPVGWWHFVEGLATSVTVAFTNFKWDNDFYTAYPPNHDF